MGLLLLLVAHALISFCGLTIKNIRQTIMGKTLKTENRYRLQSNFDKTSQECDALKQAILRQVFE